MTSIIMFFVSNAVLRVVLKIPLREQIGLYIKPLISTLIMAATVSLVIDTFTFDSVVLDLVLAVLSGATSYIMSVGVVWLITGKKDGLEKSALNILRAKLKRV